MGFVPTSAARWKADAPSPQASEREQGERKKPQRRSGGGLAAAAADFIDDSIWTRAGAWIVFHPGIALACIGAAIGEPSVAIRRRWVVDNLQNGPKPWGDILSRVEALRGDRRMSLALGQDDPAEIRPVRIEPGLNVLRHFRG